MASDMEETRFRSFAERYVVERAAAWTTPAQFDTESNATLLEAKSVYKRIAAMARGVSAELRKGVKGDSNDSDF